MPYLTAASDDGVKIVSTDDLDSADIQSSTEGSDFAQGAVVGDPLLGVPMANARPFHIEVDYRDRVCYALAYNKVPTIRTIGIRNLNGGVSGNLHVEVSMKWSASDIQPMRTFEVVLDAPAIGQKVIVDGQQFLPGFVALTGPS